MNSVIKTLIKLILLAFLLYNTIGGAQDQNIAVIGGADGPTAVFVTGKDR